jgi:hypothetical protein
LHQSKDWGLLRKVTAEDWILVTNNALEFRKRYRQTEVHPGVIFLLPAIPRAQQIELFSAALDAIDQLPEMINAALEVGYLENQIHVRGYALP